MADLILGIDPGAKGAIVALANEIGEVVRLVEPMPPTEQALVALFRSLHDTGRRPVDEIKVAYVEQLGPLPNRMRGSIAAWKLARNVGAIFGALAALQIPVVEVRPQVWQAEMNCRSRGDKNVILKRASQHFPACEAITLQTADALMIAAFGLRHWNSSGWRTGS